MMDNLKVFQIIVIGILLFVIGFYIAQNSHIYSSKSSSITCKSETNTVNLSECFNNQETTKNVYDRKCKSLLFYCTDNFSSTS